MLLLLFFLALFSLLLQRWGFKQTEEIQEEFLLDWSCILTRTLPSSLTSLTETHSSPLVWPKRKHIFTYRTSCILQYIPILFN